MDQIPGGDAEVELEVSLIVKEYSLEFTCKALGFFSYFLMLLETFHIENTHICCWKENGI